MANKTSWVVIVLILLASLIVFGYLWSQMKTMPLQLYMEVFSMRLAEIATKGPILWGQAVFVLAGGAVFLYTLGSVFVIGEKKLIFPLLTLAMGLGYASIIEPMFGITKIWMVPLILIISIFATVYWLTRLFPKE